MDDHLVRNHPPVSGKKRAICLALSKRRGGVTSLEALKGGGGSRLAAHIGKLEGRGHRFRRLTEGAERYTRYWWTGYRPDGEKCPAQISEPLHNSNDESGVPPVLASNPAAASLKEGEERRV